MGLAFTIDSPVKVAQYGISSAISIMEDRLTEMMRKHYYPWINENYFPISTREENYREKRITDYLNLVGRIVSTQIEKLKNSVFENGSDVAKYFEMLPEDGKLKRLYRQLNQTTDPIEKEKLAEMLKGEIRPGSIDVNIMTKLDKDNYNYQGDLIENGSDALAALKGYARSNLNNSSVIFSAGLNPRLYNFLENLREFDANDEGEFEKKIVIKVSDYRSALIQGKYLAKKGRWVSEFRIESGLNCGGHAFATEGYLMGPILEEFKTKREELSRTLFELYNQALQSRSAKTIDNPPPIRITVQGGIGTFEELKLLQDYYQIDSTGWGTPFLLVPEATTVDAPTLEKLKKAKQGDLYLSRNSPLGVPFHYLKGTSSEIEKKQRIEAGKPGSPCTERHLVNNTEFTPEPICTASAKYQNLKIKQLKSLGLPQNQYEQQLQEVQQKECLCIGLSNAAASTYDQTFIKNLRAVTICPGPNIAYFSKEVSLKEMTDHIYGRTDIVEDVNRPHMFISELFLYISYLREQLTHASSAAEEDPKRNKYYRSFYAQLKNGINYYLDLTRSSGSLGEQFGKNFHHGLLEAERQLNELLVSHQSSYLSFISSNSIS